MRWLRDEALPLWDEHGVDRCTGGYFESLDVDVETRCLSTHGEVRRGRVVARQIFAFDAGHRLGWKSPLSNPVDHGCSFLFSRMHRGEGLFHTAVDSRSWRPTGDFSLYEHAFYLFALARLSTRSSELPIAETAARTLGELRHQWGKPNLGFEESRPSSLPLKSNPHMHLLEAALAWVEVTRGSEQVAWAELAQEIVTLCLTHFIDPYTGAVREYFDQDWRPARGEVGRIVEPGHQFEWAWLLMRWASRLDRDAAGRRRCFEAAAHLVTIGEQSGTDPVRGVAFNELWDDLRPKDLAAKIWPQTERIKAWCAMLELAHAPGEVDRAIVALAAAIRGLQRYLIRQPTGLWHEVLAPDGTFTSEPCKASSFYHIVCAIEMLDGTIAPSANKLKPRPDRIAE